MLPFNDTFMKDLACRCPRLRALNIHDCTVCNISFLPPKIEALELVNAIWQPRWMKDKLKTLPLLKYLRLDHTVAVKDVDMHDIASCTGLEHLSLRGCSRVGEFGIAYITNHLFELEYFDLSGTMVNDSAVDDIVYHLKKLKQLFLAKCVDISDAAVGSIAAGLPVLEELNISFCEGITLRGLEALFVSSITKLVVKRAPRMSEEEKQNLKSGFSDNFVLVA